MSSNTFASRRIAVLVISLFALCGVSATGQSAGTPLTVTTAPAAQGHAASVAASTEEEETPLKNDASHQGIKVHGHWKIVVKNPDGSIAQTREFENSLLAPSLLAAMLQGISASAGLIVRMTSNQSICGTVYCALAPSTSAGEGGQFCSSSNVTCSSGLTTTGTGNGVMYAGQLTASQTGTVTSVATVLGSCIATVTPANCLQATSSNITAYLFTGTTLPSAVSVNSGQIVQVSVTISFS